MKFRSKERYFKQFKIKYICFQRKHAHRCNGINPCNLERENFFSFHLDNINKMHGVVIILMNFYFFFIFTIYLLHVINSVCKSFLNSLWLKKYEYYWEYNFQLILSITFNLFLFSIIIRLWTFLTINVL